MTEKELWAMTAALAAANPNVGPPWQVADLVVHHFRVRFPGGQNEYFGEPIQRAASAEGKAGS